MPARLLVIMRMKRTILPLLAYSCIYMPLITPKGKANKALPTIR